MIEVGRICMKTAGREAGKFCVIVDVLEEGMVMVTGPKAATKVKRRKCSIHHVEPTPMTVKIKKNAADEDVIAAYKHAGVFQKMGVHEPGAKEVADSKDAERKRMTEAKAHAHKAEKKEEKAAEPVAKHEHAEHKKAEHKPEHHAEKHEAKEGHAAEHHKEAKAHKPKAEKKAPAKKPAKKAEA